MIASKTVKKLRIWLLVLLAILLPIRGAVAVGMLCEEPGALPPTTSHSHQPAHDPASVHNDVQQALGSTHGDAFVSPGCADACNLCVVYCGSVTAMANLVLTVPAPLDWTVAPIPFFAAAVPSFVPDGLERPPRTI